MDLRLLLWFLFSAGGFCLSCCCVVVVVCLACLFCGFSLVFLWFFLSCAVVLLVFSAGVLVVAVGRVGSFCVWSAVGFLVGVAVSGFFFWCLNRWGVCLFCCLLSCVLWLSSVLVFVVCWFLLWCLLAGDVGSVYLFPVVFVFLFLFIVVSVCWLVAVVVLSVVPLVFGVVLLC